MRLIDGLRKSGNLYIDLAKRDLLREDILSELVRMLEARYYFSERVYYHHAKVAAGALVARAVDLLVRAALEPGGNALRGRLARGDARRLPFVPQSFDAVAGFVVGPLLGRRLHEVGGRRLNRSTHALVECNLRAANCIDCYAGRVWAVFDF